MHRTVLQAKWTFAQFNLWKLCFCRLLWLLVAKHTSLLLPEEPFHLPDIACDLWNYIYIQVENIQICYHHCLYIIQLTWYHKTKPHDKYTLEIMLTAHYGEKQHRHNIAPALWSAKHRSTVGCMCHRQVWSVISFMLHGICNEINKSSYPACIQKLHFKIIRLFNLEENLKMVKK